MAAQDIINLTDIDALLGGDDYDCYEVTGRYFSEYRNGGYRVTAELADGGDLYLHGFALEVNARHFMTELSLGRVAYDTPRAIEIEVENGVTTLVRYR